MKKISVFFILFLITAFLISDISFAEENVGFVKRTWRRFFSTFRRPPEKEAQKSSEPSPGLMPQPAPEKPPTEEKSAKDMPQQPALKQFSFDEVPEEDMPQPLPDESPIKDASAEDIRERITHILGVMPQAANLIKELTLATDEEGKVVGIEYEVDGIFRPLEEISDKDTLIKLYSRVNNERARIQTERIQKQVQAAARAAQNIPRPPQIYTPPTIPMPPPPPPRVHQPPPMPPSQPPSPPRR